MRQTSPKSDTSSSDSPWYQTTNTNTTSSGFASADSQQEDHVYEDLQPAGVDMFQVGNELSGLHRFNPGQFKRFVQGEVGKAG